MPVTACNSLRARVPAQAAPGQRPGLWRGLFCKKYASVGLPERGVLFDMLVILTVILKERAFPAVMSHGCVGEDFSFAHRASLQQPPRARCAPGCQWRHVDAAARAWLHAVQICTRFTRYKHTHACLLYTSPSPRDATLSRMPSSA